MPTEFRPLSSGEAEHLATMDQVAFGEASSEGARHAIANLMEFDRTIGAFESSSPVDGRSAGGRLSGELVGLVAALSFQMTVPGGAVLPTAAVTFVSVLPTHRRRGLLREMIHRQLDEIRDREEPLAALFASEAPIYGRFGYGIATFAEQWKIDAERARLSRPPAGPGEVRFVDAHEAVGWFKGPFERERLRRPGMVDRTEAWWNERLMDPVAAKRPNPPSDFYAVYLEGRDSQGAVHYRVRGSEERYVIANSMEVRDFLTSTREAREALWDFLLNIDLIAEIRARVPVDDPLPWMLSDIRAVERRVGDHMYLRIVDIPKALAARRYANEDRLVLDVEDEFGGRTEGTYVLDGGRDGADCRATGESPDLRLSVTDLASIYLGGVSLGSLARAGRVSEEEAGAVWRMDRMFQTELAPYPALGW